MIPLAWFLIAWLVLVGLFAIFAFVTTLMSVKFGVTTPTTYVTTALFLIGIVVVLLMTGGYLLTVDWSQGYNVFGSPTAGLE